jgi:hypothetical protein
MPFSLDTYKDVAARIADLKSVYPNASLQPLNPLKPYEIVTLETDENGPRTFIVYVAACYRSETDEHPGVGVAWEPFPGTSNFTRTSELMNAETSAWGRAIVAALASESRSIASAEEVRNRRASEQSRRYYTDEASSDRETDENNFLRAQTSDAITPNQARFLHLKAHEKGLTEHELNDFAAKTVGTNVEQLTKASASKLIDAIIALP